MYQIAYCKDCTQPFNMALNAALHYGIRKVCPACTVAMNAAEQAQKSSALTRAQKDFAALIGVVGAGIGLILVAQALDQALDHWLA
ncbi:MAG: hypothetical protein ABI596_03025 [Pyrinomonadaceae bacterium]